MEKKSAYDALMDAEATFCRTEGYMEKKAFPALIGWGARLLPRLLPYAARAGQAIAGWAGRGASAIGRGINLLNQGAVTAVRTAKAHPFASGMAGQQVLSGMIDDAKQPKETQQQPSAPAPQPVPQPAQTPPTFVQGGRAQAPVISAELQEQIRKWLESHRNRPFGGYADPLWNGMPHRQPAQGGMDPGLIAGVSPWFQYPGRHNPLFQSPTQAQPYNGWTPRGTYINGRLYTGGMMGGDDPLSL